MTANNIITHRTQAGLILFVRDDMTLTILQTVQSQTLPYLLARIMAAVMLQTGQIVPKILRTEKSRP